MWNVASNEAFINVPTLSNINRSSIPPVTFQLPYLEHTTLTGLKLMCIRSMASVDLARKVPTEYVCQHCV